LTTAFLAEEDEKYVLVNGAWSIHLSKMDGEAEVLHAYNQGYSGAEFWPPKLGKPYDEEFNLIKPASVAYSAEGGKNTMQVEYISEKFPGMAVISIFTIDAAGIVSRAHRVENRGETTREVWLSDMNDVDPAGRTAFWYDGRMLQDVNAYDPAGSFFGADDIDPDKFTENWIYEDSATAPRGAVWQQGTNPAFQWGCVATFEHDCGEMPPGAAFTTPAIEYVYGIFTSAAALREYARGIREDKSTAPPAKAHEIIINARNPFIFAGATPLSVEILNNRQSTMEGEYAISTRHGLFSAQTQVDDNEEACEKTTFTAPIENTPAVDIADIKISTLTHQKAFTRALFSPSGEVKFTHDGTAITADNGAMQWRVDASYGPVCYSLTCGGHEWLLNQYPEHKPFAWWNILLGGIRVIPQHMNNKSALKEKITADTVQLRDNYGNLWQGLRTTMEITEDEQLKGARYETYFVSQPGVPLLATFYRFINNTGVYRKDKPEVDIFLRLTDGEPGGEAHTTDHSGQKAASLLGASEVEAYFRGTARLCSPQRAEQMYVFHGNTYSEVTQHIYSDNKVPGIVSVYEEAAAAHGETFTSRPLVTIITAEKIPHNALEDFEWLCFSSSQV
jgi:hypothetical protein